MVRVITAGSAGGVVDAGGNAAMILLQNLRIMVHAA
jgi:hypothetical protein